MSNLTQQTAIDTGRQHYAAKRYRAALEHFTRAMKLCPCSRGMSRDRCGCKDFEKVASQNGSIFHEAMHTCTCAVGETFSKCSYAAHIQALDYRAATFEAIGQLERARKDAEWILELAPRQPEGYLRLGKIARLLKKHEFAWKIYNAGIEASNPDVEADLPKIRELYAARKPLQIRFSRKDPLCMPHEIIQLVFSQLDFKSLVRCLGVSKTWAGALATPVNRRLWRRLHFTNLPARGHPNIATLRKLVSYSGNDAREIIITNATRFRLTNAKFLALMNGAQAIERLEIGKPLEALIDPKTTVIKPELFKSLKDLSLDGFNAADPSLRVEFPHIMLSQAAESLQHLSISMDRERLDELNSNVNFWPMMPCLKTLRLESTGGYINKFKIIPLVYRTPNLEQVWFNETFVSLEGNNTPPYVFARDVWRHLKAVVLSGSHDTSSHYQRALQFLISGSKVATLKYVDFDFRWPCKSLINTLLQQVFMPVHDDAEPSDSRYPSATDAWEQIACFRLRQFKYEPWQTQKLIGSAIRAGNLSTMDIEFPLEAHDVPIGPGSIAYLKEYDWLRGAESIRCLGVFDFNFTRYPRNSDEFPLPDFLASFPNLETLEISSEEYDEVDFYTVIKSLLKATHLKTLYQSCITGAKLDSLQAAAAENGTTILWGERPKVWPLNLEG